MKQSTMTSLISAAVSRITTTQSSTGLPVSSGGLPPSGSNYRFKLANPGTKASIRLSSSLQDLTTFARLDPEGGIDSGVCTSPHFKPYHALDREDAGSSFSKEKSSPTASAAWKKWTRVAVCLLCVCLLFSMIYLFSMHLATKTSQYYVILDCGSTGTRVYVYELSIKHRNGRKNLPIKVKSLPEGFQSNPGSKSGRAYKRMETEPGLDKLVHNASGLWAAMKPLLQWAEKQIPKHSHKSTSVFLYATAGVRRLPKSDSNWLLDEVWLILKKSSFLCQRHWVKIITGMEEAYFGWIALNYQMDKLGSSPRESTYGALDLGGSSLQVTFENKGLVPNETGLNLSLGAVNHRLSAYSLSGYGLNDAFDKSVVHLVKKLSEVGNLDLNDGKLKIEHPCLQTGYKELYFCSQCNALYQGSPLMGGSSMDGGNSGIPIELHGAPNFGQCSALAKVTVNLSEWSDLSRGLDCNVQPCALGNALPRPHGQFYAMSGFYVVFRFFKLSSDASLNDLLHKGQEFCEMTWDEAKNSVVPQPFIEQYCFRAPYIVSLLREGLQIKDGQVIMGSGGITWTLGVALLEAGRILSNRMELKSLMILDTKISPIILVALLFLSLVLLYCVLSCIWTRRPQFFRGVYLPIFRCNNVAANSVLNITSPFRFQRWSPINTGDGRAKMPLSPRIGGSDGLAGSSFHLMESFYPSVSHSYSSGSLRQMQLDNGAGSFYRSNMRLQSRRSQSREDLSSTLTEAHIMKS